MRQTTETDVATQGTFSVTFWGQGVDQKEKEKIADRSMSKGKDNGKKQRVCGVLDLYRDCFYLNES